VLRHTTAHHHEFWLAWMRDRTDKALGVEIYDATEYRRMRLHWNGCGLILHELCHIIHQFALANGLENQQVKKAHGLVKVCGLYDCVRRRDWAGLEHDFDLAYATVDCKEFFAEMSVAYWSREYDPMLDRQDPRRILLCSPPITEPNVVDRVGRFMGTTGAKSRHESFISGFFRRRTPHCNKFYPFTRGQLRQHDKATFETMEMLWEEIAAWKDPLNSDEDSGSTMCC
jgi:hypothetical protein